VRKHTKETSSTELTSGGRDPLSSVDKDNLLSEEADADSGEKDDNCSKKLKQPAAHRCLARHNSVGRQQAFNG